MMIDKLKEQDKVSQNKIGDIDGLIQKLLDDKMSEEMQKRY